MARPHLDLPVLEWDDLTEFELPFGPSQFDPDISFNSGQAFRWRRLNIGWVNTIGQAVVLVYRRDSKLLARLFDGEPGLIRDYLRADFDLMRWANASSDPLLRLTVERYKGLRVLAQPEVETILTFACSGANSVARITDSMHGMTALLGEPVATIAGVTYRAFPDASAVASAPETILRHDCGMAYRARCVGDIARALVDGLAEELPAIRQMSYEDARNRLAGYRWIGPKIADCVCLMALGFDCAVPVDTHLWRLAQTLFGVRIPTKSLTAKTYAHVSRLFREQYGNTAGWAQQYLYHASRQGALTELREMAGR